VYLSEVVTICVVVPDGWLRQCALSNTNGNTYTVRMNRIDFRALTSYTKVD
jgi:hypothetical protein